MSTPSNHIIHSFAIPTGLQDLQAYGNGHIHDTFLADFENGRQVIFQRFNTTVFPRPEAVVSNIRAVTDHLQTRLSTSGLGDWHRRVLTMIPTHQGHWLSQDHEGKYWRAFSFIQETETIEEVETQKHAYALGNTFGQFQVHLADFEGDLHETIPNFHNTRHRYISFETALQGASTERIEKATAQINFARAREAIVDVLLRHEARGDLPTRITHNDTKVNNLLFDKKTQEGICVIDLDTVMPGLSLYDFGDMVRTGIVTASESERNLEKIGVDLARFGALAEGYLTATKSLLTKLEQRLLVFSGQLLTFETGLRFLTDYLQGDVYFKIHYPEQNLDRCRNQFRLVEVLEQNHSKMNVMVENSWSQAHQTNVPVAPLSITR